MKVKPPLLAVRWVSMQSQITERTIQSQWNEGNASTVDSALKQQADSHRGRVNSKYMESLAPVTSESAEENRVLVVDR